MTTLWWPVVVQITLTFGLFVLLVMRKAQAVRRDHFDRRTAELDPNAWPDAVVQVNNNLTNQFQAPVLFFVLVTIAQSTIAPATLASAVAHGAAWAFVALRIAHAVVHTTTNTLSLRTPAFALGMIALLVLLVDVAIALGNAA